MASYVPTALPGFTYTGRYETELRADWGWVIRLKTSGMLRFTDRDRTVDVFVVGGGGGGAAAVYSTDEGRGGGGGGYTAMASGVQAKTGTAYWVEIGEGGAAGDPAQTGSGGEGGASSAFGLSAAGGKGANRESCRGADGGSGGGNGGDAANGYWGYDGGSNGASAASGGAGAGQSTYEFRMRGWRLYAGGGGGGGSGEAGVFGAGYAGGGSGGNGGGGDGGGSYHYDGDHAGKDAKENTGGGGGGAGAQHDAGFVACGGKGGSGIVVIRNSAGDVLPVVFNGTWLTQLFLNGTDVKRLIYDGFRVYMRAIRKRICGRSWRYGTHGKPVYRAG